MISEYGIGFETRTEIGYAADVIARIAEEEDFELIVMGSRGLSGIASFFLGSVADRVAHTSTVAVLLVK